MSNLIFTNNVSYYDELSIDQLTRIYDQDKKYYRMVKITTKRGTATTIVENVKNWAGETFRNFQKEQLKAAGPDADLVQKRGTSTIKVKDIPNVPQPSLKGQKITTKRGTSTETL
tara:strand:+ start:382 stop:726 length:345 start_codon:yes stop_codon:yes gene_type:complete